MRLLALACAMLASGYAEAIERITAARYDDDAFGIHAVLPTNATTCALLSLRPPESGFDIHPPSTSCDSFSAPTVELRAFIMSPELGRDTDAFAMWKCGGANKVARAPVRAGSIVFRECKPTVSDGRVFMGAVSVWPNGVVGLQLITDCEIDQIATCDDLRRQMLVGLRLSTGPVR